MPDKDREFDDFVASSGRRLLRAAQLLTGDRHRAEDLLQDVLARTYARWDRIDGNPEAYVRRGLVNGQHLEAPQVLCRSYAGCGSRLVAA